MTTVETTGPHSRVVDDNIEIFDVGAEALDGSGVVATVPDDTHFTFAQAGADTGRA
jgi:hypothetical protein